MFRVWLICLILAALGLVMLGGATRLTDSGLSMVEWRPILGWLPPMDGAQWERIFDLYRQSGEYRLQNAGMDLERFKEIYRWEYGHRLAARFFGLLVIGPFLWFAWRGTLRRGILARLLVVVVLVGAQGFLGWLMVQSGLVEDRTDVSPLWLGAHLLLAMLIITLLFRLAFDRSGTVMRSEPASYRRWVHVLAVLLVLTIFSGALVAGSDGGKIYNSWPLMGDSLFPQDYRWGDVSWLDTAIHNPSATQLHHRSLALTSLVFILGGCAFWIRGAGYERRCEIFLLAFGAGAQFSLGVVTLLSGAKFDLALAHQAGAFLLFLLVQWVLLRLNGATGPKRLRAGQ